MCKMYRVSYYHPSFGKVSWDGDKIKPDIWGYYKTKQEALAERTQLQSTRCMGVHIKKRKFKEI